jgi:hypothetical protein
VLSSQHSDPGKALMVRHYVGVCVRGSLVGFCGLSARRVLLKHPHCPRNPSFRVKTAPELIAYAKANPGKITMGSPFSVRPAVAKLEDLNEPLRRRAAQGALKKRRGSSARSNSIDDGPQIHSTNHRHNFMVNS